MLFDQPVAEAAWHLLLAGGRSEDAGPSTSQPEHAGPRLIANRRQTLALAGASLFALRAGNAAADESAARSDNLWKRACFCSFPASGQTLWARTEAQRMRATALEA